MKVLLLGATGNLGSRLVPALLSHSHTVVAYIRSSSKLRSLLPGDIFSRITVVEGDARDPAQIKAAILNHGCDAAINTAGLAALMPWGKSELPVIVKAVVQAAQEAGQETGRPLRVWILGGMGMMELPGSKYRLVDYVPVYLTHKVDLALLQSLPTGAMRWTMLCPSVMTPASQNLGLPAHGKKNGLIAKARTLPEWQDSWVKHIPLLGNFLWCGLNASRYSTTLEDNAEFIADDLDKGTDEWVGQKVGVIEAAKALKGKGKKAV